jgi:hypothetical protein
MQPDDTGEWITPLTREQEITFGSSKSDKPSVGRNIIRTKRSSGNVLPKPQCEI